MKKLYAVIAVLTVTLTTGCSTTRHATSNRNTIQTNVELSSNNFRVIKQVHGSARASYFFGIGGLSRKSLEANAYADMVNKANLRGSQTLINVFIEEKHRSIIIYGERRINATATVIEFTDIPVEVTLKEENSSFNALNEKVNSTVLPEQNVDRPDLSANPLAMAEIDAMSRSRRDRYKIELDKELLDACRYMNQHPESIKDLLPKTEERFEIYKYLIGKYYNTSTYMRGYEFLERHLESFRKTIN